MGLGGQGGIYPKAPDLPPPGDHYVTRSEATVFSSQGRNAFAKSSLKTRCYSKVLRTMPANDADLAPLPPNSVDVFDVLASPISGSRG